MARWLVVLLLLIYDGAGIAVFYLPDGNWPWLLALAGAALLLALALSVVQMTSDQAP